MRYQELIDAKRSSVAELNRINASIERLRKRLDGNTVRFKVYEELASKKLDVLEQIAQIDQSLSKKEFDDYAELYGMMQECAVTTQETAAEMAKSSEKMLANGGFNNFLAVFRAAKEHDAAARQYAELKKVL